MRLAPKAARAAWVISQLKQARLKEQTERADRERLAGEARLDDRRLRSLVKISHHRAATLQELLNLALDEMVALSDSQIGYIYYYSEEEERFTLHAWSNETMSVCSITDPQTVYALANTGIWGEAVRQRKPIIVNDFLAPNPLKKGYPEGHAPLRRFLTVPVFSYDRIVAVVGVANKEAEYTDGDVRQLSQMMDSVWKIAERTQAELALNASEANYRTLMENTPDIIVRFDRECRYLYANSAQLRLFGMAPQDFIGKSLREVGFAEVQAASWEQAIRGVLKTGRPFETEFDYCHANVTSTFNWRIIPEFDADGRVQTVLSISRDVTARKAAERELARYRDQLEEQVKVRTAELERAKQQAEEANRAKSLFLANMSHELRTPLTAILGFSSLMGREPTLSKSQRENLAIINRSGEHLLALIDDVLDVVKIEAGRMAVENAPFDMGALVRDVADIILARTGEKGLQLNLEQRPDFPRFVLADAAKIRQVLINLLGNAVKFTERGAVALRLSSTPADDPQQLMLVFEVEDSGIGIAVADQARVFEPFVQVGRPAAQQGTGLGLTITRQCVELMGGSIVLESEPGRGALFRVMVPVRLAAEAEVAKTNVNGRQVIALQPGQPEYRVLILEDHLENQLLLKKLLERVGFRVRVAANGAEGVAIFPAWRPDFIWMDRRMPIMDGLEATRRIRALEGGRDVKIAATTASVFSEQRHQMLRAGMDDFVRKPYTSEEIFECMARHLGVRYLYDNDLAKPDQQPGEALTPEQLAGLPRALRSALSNALIHLRVERITELIGRVGEHDAALGKLLSRYADSLDYTAILQALQSGSGGKI